MDNLNDLQRIWHTAKTDSLPGSNEIILMSKKYRNQKLAKKVATIIAGLLLTATMLATVFVYKSAMVTTRIGEGFIIIAGLMLVYTNTNSIGRFYRFKDYNNKNFLEFLMQTRVNQIYFHKKTQVIALAFCSAGLLLYIFEPAYGHPLFAIIAYPLIIIYILVLWLVVRPRVFKNQAEKLDKTINKLEQLAKQL